MVRQSLIFFMFNTIFAGQVYAADVGMSNTEIRLGMVDTQSGAVSLGQGLRAGTLEVFNEVDINDRIHGQHRNLLVDGCNSETLRKTDAVLYSAKEKGRNGFQLYIREMHVQVEEQTVLENAWRQTIVRHEVDLYYQPKVDLNSCLFNNSEALLRLHRSAVGLTSPESFIPLAEETGLIISIGEWELRTACVQAKTWQVTGDFELSMAVNIPARQFPQQNIAELVRNTLLNNGFAAEYLELIESGGCGQ